MPIQLGAIKRTPAPVQAAPAEKPSIKIVPIRNDRSLEDYELLAEEKADKLSIKYFKRIHPVIGTLGYLFRDLTGGNAGVYHAVKNALPSTNFMGQSPKINRREQLANQIIKIWSALDEFSQQRVDVFDWLCDRVNLNRDDFYGIYSKGLFHSTEALAQRMLNEAKLEVINTSRQLAQEDRNFKDRELIAKSTGLLKDAPLIGNIDASTKIQNNLTYTSNFSSAIKSTESDVKELMNVKNSYVEGEIVEDERMQLTEGNSNYLNEETQIESEEELLAVLRK